MSVDIGAEEVQAASSNAAEEKHEMEKQTTHLCTVRARRTCSDATSTIELAWPRTYNCFTKIFLPLFVLIGIAFMGGYFLVLLEGEVEMTTNDELIASYADFAVRISNDPVLDNNTDIELCVATIDTSDSIDGIAEQLRDCAAKFVGTDAEVSAAVTFNWISCSRDGKPQQREEQVFVVLKAWMESYRDIVVEQMETEEATFVQAHMSAIQSASGHDGCRINTAAGALFWFTVMTTIGYGNVAPATRGGQGLVISLGFVSILSFTAIIANAGRVFLAIADDFFLRINLPALTRGAWSSLFWLSAWWLWVLTIAGIATKTAQSVEGTDDGDFPLHASFWFAWISSTTVGLGDIHIPHETFKPRDMFYVPFMFLLAFVLLSNFLHKFSELVGSIFSREQSLESILESQRNNKQGGR